MVKANVIITVTGVPDVLSMRRVAEAVLEVDAEAVLVVARPGFADAAGPAVDFVAVDIAVAAAGVEAGVDVVLGGGAEVREDEGCIEVVVVVFN